VENTQESVGVCSSPEGNPLARETRRRDEAPDADERTRSLALASADGAARRSGRLFATGSTPAPGSERRPTRSARTVYARTAPGGMDERLRLERDLHDGVQNELVALIVKLALVEQDPQVPPALAATLAELEAHAQSALDSLRNIAHGIYPRVLADFGIERALRAQALRAAIGVRLVGSASRSTEYAEEAIYFSCSEAIQNAAKHAGRAANVALRLHQRAGILLVRIADDGRGFDPAQTPAGAGLQNIRDRIEDLDGSFHVASNPGLGTVLTILLPWPARNQAGL
jgi:signal transduction histidine kinase